VLFDIPNEFVDKHLLIVIMQDPYVEIALNEEFPYNSKLPPIFKVVFAAFRSFKSKDLTTASLNFKSILFGTRILEILELKKFPFIYDEIFELSSISIMGLFSFFLY
jgi:hypothetical protein